MHGLAAYDRHGDALFSLALLLCRDIDRAVDAVVATVAQAYRVASGPLPEVELQHLAADLWLRCADPLLPHSGLPLPCSASICEASSSDLSSDREHVSIGLFLSDAIPTDRQWRTSVSQLARQLPVSAHPCDKTRLHRPAPGLRGSSF